MFLYMFSVCGQIDIMLCPYIVLNTFTVLIHIAKGQFRSHCRILNEPEHNVVTDYYNYIIMWSCPGNMPKYYSIKYHYRNLHFV